MAKLITWMNNELVGELTKQTTGAHMFRYDDGWMRNARARPSMEISPLMQ